MDNEQNQPAQQQSGQSGQSQHPGQRRRRRRRGHGKKQHAGGAQPQNNGGGQGQHQGHGGGGGGKGHGGRSGGGGGQQRRNRSRRGGGGQSFVGPMDHSYRSGQANGNVADNGNRAGNVNGNGFQQPNRFPVPDMTPVAAKPDAPARIFLFIDDLFFFAKIQEIAKKLNIKVEFVKTVEQVLERTGEDVPEEERPSLVVIDLNNLSIKPLSLMPKLRSGLKKGTSIVGFVSHIQGDLKLKAQEAGFDVVMPRSAFSQNLPQLLRRHGSTEEDRYEPQP
jgi:hypothetical protein